MTRDEFMEKARKEIDQVLVTQKNRLMNIIEQAWAEGKRNAETSALEAVMNDVLNKFDLRPRIVEVSEEGMECPTGSWATIEAMKWATNDNDIPEACKRCSNHPRNGGSGICHCTMGGVSTT